MQILNATWPNASRIKAFTTLRTSKLENLNLPKNQFWLNQEHGNKILNAEELFISNSPPYADGSYTTKANVACIVKTADCLPILIMDLSENFVAAIHAGWRGLANGIINNFFQQIKPLNLSIKNLLFWLGPAIGTSAFEVGEDVFKKFSTITNYDYKPAFKKITINKLSNKYLANIYKIAIINLCHLGIKQHQIFTENWCTYSRNDLFYSYRKEPNNENRMYSIIWIK